MKLSSAARTILIGGLVVGLLDLADAIIFFGFRGVPARQIPQSIAAGLLGRAAFSGGTRTVILGTALHFFNASVIVAVYYFASKRLRVLTTRPVLWGFFYGVLVYLFMNFVVIPLSASTRGALRWPVVVNGVAIHLFGVGLPTALIVRKGARDSGLGIRD